MLTSWFQSNITPSLGAWVGPIHFVAGSAQSSGAGALVGYTKQNWYNSPDAGTIDTDLFIDMRVPASPKVIRLTGIVQQTTYAIVIGWQPTNLTPNSSMPVFTGNLKIKGTTYTRATGRQPGINNGYDGLYWTGNLALVAGQQYSFEFV